MLEVQKYLRNNSLLSLRKDVGIISAHHKTEPLVLLSYLQGIADKFDPVVRECRGLILRSDNFDFVARGFYRFFNWDEKVAGEDLSVHPKILEEQQSFDFNNFDILAKEDGSYINLFFFNGSWRITTSGSFGQAMLPSFDMTFEDAVKMHMKVSDFNEIDGFLDRRLNYIFEFACKYNKIVRSYGDESKMFLLTAFNGINELSQDETDRIKLPFAESVPKYDLGKINANIVDAGDGFELNMVDRLRLFLEFNSKIDPTFEGFIIRDKNNVRFKVKSLSYLNMHHNLDNGRIYKMENIVNTILKRETSELLAYYPELKVHFEEWNEILNVFIDDVLYFWRRLHKIENRVEYASKVFQLRDMNILLTIRDLYDKRPTKEQVFDLIANKHHRDFKRHCKRLIPEVSKRLMEKEIMSFLPKR